VTLVTSPGILLRSHPYSETSAVLRFLTPEHGIVSVLGKGVRRRGPRTGVPIESLGEGVLTFVHNPDRDLHTLREFHPGAGSMALGRDVQRFVGACLVAELLLGHALEHGDPELYEWVRFILHHLGTVPVADVPAWILSGGWRTLAFLGFPPGLVRCVGCGRELGQGGIEGESDRFDVGAGGIRCSECSSGTGMPRIGPEARRHLMALVEGEPFLPLPGLRAHLNLLESFCSYHVAPRQGIHSFGMLRTHFDQP
jgi:DNA repair protein RecO